jgi:hypothetical protein
MRLTFCVNEQIDYNHDYDWNDWNMAAKIKILVENRPTKPTAPYFIPRMMPCGSARVSSLSGSALGTNYATKPGTISAHPRLQPKCSEMNSLMVPGTETQNNGRRFEETRHDRDNCHEGSVGEGALPVTDPFAWQGLDLANKRHNEINEMMMLVPNEKDVIFEAPPNKMETFRVEEQRKKDEGGKVRDDRVCFLLTTHELTLASCLLVTGDDGEQKKAARGTKKTRAKQKKDT